MKKELLKHEQVERSIIKKYRKNIWSKFIDGINEYQLIADGDCIAVCISGGKDSMLLAKCMQELQRHGKQEFELKFLVMDPGYNAYNRELILQNAKTLNIPITLFDTQIFDIVADIENSPCYLCARMRRGYLYKEAQSLGCNKIALGHHFDDVIETTLMSMLYSAEIKTMMPKLHSQNFEGMELIRPLYKVREKDVIMWRNHNELNFLQCACKFTEIAPDVQHGGGKRKEMKELIKTLKDTNPHIEMNIFRSAHNVNLDTILGYRKDGEHHSFLETYRQD